MTQFNFTPIKLKKYGIYDDYWYIAETQPNKYPKVNSEVQLDQWFKTRLERAYDFNAPSVLYNRNYCYRLNDENWQRLSFKLKRKIYINSFIYVKLWNLLTDISMFSFAFMFYLLLFWLIIPFRFYSWVRT